jgi:hypothetical protein
LACCLSGGLIFRRRRGFSDLPESDQTDNLQPQVTPPTEADQPVATTDAPRENAETAGQDAALGDTTGMGTVLALGCIGGTVFLIVIGLIYLLITQLFG